MRSQKTAQFQNEQVIGIWNDLYVKTPDAVASLLDKLRALGYEIKNLREEKHRENVSIEDMEKNGWSLWFASLDIRRGKCGSCQGLISTTGIRCHGHRCELCGAVTYRDIIDGSVIRFRFAGDHGMWSDIKVTARNWDTENGFLYCYEDTVEDAFSRMRRDKAREYLASHSDKYEVVIAQDGRTLLRFKHPFEARYRAFSAEEGMEESVMEVADIYGHEWNHSIVSVWNGVEYPEFSRDLPVPDSISIYESWHWAPLQASPTLHKRLISAVGMVSDQGYYYQDGRPAFSRDHFSGMGDYIQHFTALDREAWEAASARFRLDGPGAVEDIAAFCHPDSAVENRPNIGNLINGYCKATSGAPMSKREVDAMGSAWNDDYARSTFIEVLAESGKHTKR